MVNSIWNKLFMNYTSEPDDPTTPLLPQSPPLLDDLADSFLLEDISPLEDVSEDVISTAPLEPLAEDEEEPTATFLLPHASPPPAFPKLSNAHCSHPGAIRPRNEDSYVLFQSDTGGQSRLMPFGLYVIADGMGGHFAGHEASRRASRMVSAYVVEHIYLALLQENPEASQSPIQETLAQAIKLANQDLYNPNPQQDMGSTLTAALVFGRRLYLAHVGDSRAYLWRNNHLELLTTDHSYVQRLQDAGQLTADQAANHPQRHVLYRAVGQGGELDVDTMTYPLPAQGKLLLCSDGLWGIVPEPVLAAVLQEKESSLDEKVQTLLELALQAGGHDNITVIIIDFSF